jgi:hypothetical protein
MAEKRFTLGRGGRMGYLRKVSVQFRTNCEESIWDAPVRVNTFAIYQSLFVKLRPGMRKAFSRRVIDSGTTAREPGCPPCFGSK